MALLDDALDAHGGIPLPTLCRWFRVGPDGKPAGKPGVIGMEIFDARFD